eukprot:COSAG01_NODE_16530_length_1229_cov_1.361062_2_plen_140_part_01
MSLPALMNVGTLLFRTTLFQWYLCMCSIRLSAETNANVIVLLFVYSILGISLFHSACTVPPPFVTDIQPAIDPCTDDDKLAYADYFCLALPFEVVERSSHVVIPPRSYSAAFVARNASEAALAWSQSTRTGQDPADGWDA